MTIKKFLTIIFFPGLAAVAYTGALAQPDVDLQEFKKRFPSDDACTLHVHEHIKIGIRRDKLDITNETRTDLLYLNDNSRRYASRSVYYYDQFQEIPEITASSYIPQDKKYKKFEVKNIYSRKPVRDGIFYDDFQEKYFLFSGLKEGAITTIAYTEKLKDPHFIGSYYFSGYFPVIESQFRVTFPKDVVVKYLFYGDTTGIRFTSTESRGEITWSWEGKNLARLPDDNDSPKPAYYTPHVIVYIDHYKVDGKTIEVLPDVHALYRWYYSMVKDLNLEKSPVLKALSDSLTRGLTDDESKIKAIYYWVQDQIKYIAFEEGMGGYIPREASLVCSRKYGDCKDKASLLTVLLREAGIKSYLTWIGTRDIPYTYEEMPSPMTDNHMIASVYQKGKWIFLDGTSMKLPYPHPSSFIQGKEALISLGADSFTIVKVPVLSAEANMQYDSLTFYPDHETITGTGYGQFNGLLRNRVVQRFFYYSRKEREDEFKKVFQVGNNKCILDSLTYEGFDDFSDTLKFRYKFTLPGYVRKVDNKFYINMHLVRPFQNDLIETDKRLTDRENDYQYKSRQVQTLFIPPGYKISRTPKNKNYKNENFSFDITYRVSGNYLVLVKTLEINGLMLKKSEFEEWNKMIEQLDEAYTEMVILDKK